MKFKLPLSFVLSMILFLLSACGSGDIPDGVREAIESNSFVQRVGLDPNWEIISAQRASSQHAFFQRQEVDEAWCVIISPSIIIQNGEEVRAFYVWKEGLLWKSYESVALGLYPEEAFLRVGCSNYNYRE